MITISDLGPTRSRALVPANPAWVRWHRCRRAGSAGEPGLGTLTPVSPRARGDRPWHVRGAPRPAGGPMPRYDYRCRACGDTFEVTRSMTATATVTCPHGHDDTVKLLNTIALTGRDTTTVS